MKNKIAPSLISADFACLEEQVKIVEQAGADLLHLDVMDGHFVPNITFGPLLLESLRDKSKLPFDVHLMIDNPERFVDVFTRVGADIITVHYEACDNTQMKKILQYREQKKDALRIGLAIKPKTGLEEILPYLEQLDIVLIMTVEPGFAGQSFLPEVLPKISKLHQILKEKNLDLPIEVDGGINPQTAKRCASAGANIFVAGNSIFRSGDIREAIYELRRSI